MIKLALPAKSVARAAAVATAAVGAIGLAAPAAHASGIGGIYLYRHNAGIHRNCAGGNHFIKNKGIVKINRYQYAHSAQHSSMHGSDIEVVWWREYSATKADKQLWCYRGSYYNEFFAANQWSRDVRQHWLCSGGKGLGDCNVYLFTSDTPWKRL